MEYIQTYDINRKMHARPFADVVRTVGDLEFEHDGLTIKLEASKTGESFDCESIINLLMVGSPFNIGEKVKIITMGEYPIETLKKYADRVGGIFSFKDTSRTTWEEIYKREYGCYPDEKPSKKII